MIVECFTRADICIVVDSSGSIRDANPPDNRYDNWNLILQFVTGIISAFPISEQDTRIGVVIFSNNALFPIPLNKFYREADLKKGVMNVNYIGGTTNTAEGLELARTSCFDPMNGDRPDVENIAIVITDGIPTVRESDTRPEANKLKQVANVLAIGITENAEKSLLRDISSAPQLENSNYFSAPDFTSLQKILNTLITETCDGEISTSPPIAGNKSSTLTSNDKIATPVLLYHM